MCVFLCEHSASSLALSRWCSLLCRLLRVTHGDVVLDTKLIGLLLQLLQIATQLADHILNLTKKTTRTRVIGIRVRIEQREQLHLSPLFVCFCLCCVSPDSLKVLLNGRLHLLDGALDEHTADAAIATTIRILTGQGAKDKPDGERKEETRREERVRRRGMMHAYRGV